MAGNVSGAIHDCGRLRDIAKRIASHPSWWAPRQVRCYQISPRKNSTSPWVAYPCSRNVPRKNEKEQPDHSSSLGDSITSSTRIRFLVHTGQKIAYLASGFPPLKNGNVLRAIGHGVARTNDLKLRVLRDASTGRLKVWFATPVHRMQRCPP